MVCVNVIEYDPNPLQSLGKRTKNKTNPEPTDVTADQTTVANCFSFQSEPNNHLQSREDKDKDKDNKAYKYGKQWLLHTMLGLWNKSILNILGNVDD